MNLLVDVIVLLAVFIIVMIAVDSNRFHTVCYRVDTGKLPKTVKIAFLSDLHNKKYGTANEKILTAVELIRPDLVLIGGDMVTARRTEKVENIFPLLEELVKRYPVYYGSGNHEQRFKLYPENYGDAGERLEQGIANSGAIRLINERVSLPDLPMDISSVEIGREFYKRRMTPPMTKEDMEALLPASGASDRLQLLLAHNPEHFAAYAGWGADLVLAGHMHGGIIRVPFLGGVISPKLTLFPKYDGGQFDEEGSTMIVSRGLGSHTIPFRLFNPGELVEIILS